MKNYITPNIELISICATDIMTTSGDRFVKSSLIPDVCDVVDGVSFM